MSDSFPLIASCAFGLEAVVRRELESLGYEGRVTSPGRISFMGDALAICRTNLWLRCADRVLVSLAEFPASDFDQLFDSTRSLDWARWLPPDAAFPVTGKSIKSQLSSVPAIQRSVKKASVLGMQKAHGVEQLSETGAEFKLEIALLKDQASLTLDTTGHSLHRRGYRQWAGGAPLKETLAAAMVLLSFWNPERPLIDPFCGSGTIPIEAALVGMNRAPGLQRTFTAETWPTLPQTLWEQAREEANDKIIDEIGEKLIGTDVDPRVLGTARQNAELAGVASWIHFQNQPFESLSSSRKHGCLITNPPYGQRIGADQDLQRLYQSIPLVLRNLPTWSHYILTAFPQFERLVGKQADRRRKLYNGRIECTYFQYHGPRRDAAAPTKAETNTEQSPPAESTAAFGQLSAKATEQAELFATRLRKRARHLRRLPTRQGITCYRLYERDVPELPFVVDRYEDHLHIIEYDRPHERSTAEHANWLDLMAITAAKTLEIPKGQTFLKKKERQEGSSQHQHVSESQHEIVVDEGGLRFIVNLSDYVDTGLFLDHRLTRGMLGEQASGCRVLNLFAYTGSFSVYAAAGGAQSTTTVDWSNTYLDWAKRNMKINGFSEPQHQFVRESATQFVENAAQQGERFDLAIVDPPTFSNSKRTEQIWDIQKHHAEFLNRVLGLIEPGGTVFFSSNFRKLKFDPALIHATEVREISKQTIPPEYRNRRIHRCWRITK